MKTKRGQEWYELLPPKPGERVQRLLCKACREKLPFEKRQYMTARRYHFEPGAELCQGMLRITQGQRTVLGRSVMEYFGEHPHYGRVVYQHDGLIYRGRTEARTQWRVQFEDGDEYDRNFDQVMAAVNLFNNSNPAR